MPPSARSSTRGTRRGRARRGSSDRKSTRLNSSHLGISYAVFCLKKKKHELGIGYYHDIEKGWWNEPLFECYHCKAAANQTKRRLLQLLNYRHNREGTEIILECMQ